MEEIIGFEDICTPAQFEKEFQHLFGKGAPNMKYLIRTRRLNGLSDCGAVVEPVERRPMIVKPKFLRWLLSRTQQGKSDVESDVLRDAWLVNQQVSKSCVKKGTKKNNFTAKTIAS